MLPRAWESWPSRRIWQLEKSWAQSLSRAIWQHCFISREISPKKFIGNVCNAGFEVCSLQQYAVKIRSGCSTSPCWLALLRLLLSQLSPRPHGLCLVETLWHHGFYSWDCLMPSHWVPLSFCITLVCLTCHRDFERPKVSKFLMTLQSSAHQWAGSFAHV